MTSGEETTVSNRDKAEIMAKSFAKIHSTENLSEEGRRRGESTMTQYPVVLDRREDTGEAIDEQFTSAEMLRAIDKSKPTSPGIDMIYYVMLKHSALSLYAACYC